MFWWVFETSLTCCQSQNLVWIKMFNKFNVKFLFRRRPLFFVFFRVDRIFQGIQNGYVNISCSGRICWILFEAFIMDINTFYLPFNSFFFSRKSTRSFATFADKIFSCCLHQSAPVCTVCLLLVTLLHKTLSAFFLRNAEWVCFCTSDGLEF